MVLASLARVNDCKCIFEKSNNKFELSKKDGLGLNNLVSMKDRDRMLSARLILKMLLEENNFKSLSVNQLDFDKYGKPVLPGIFVSISHSEDYAAVAISATDRVGLDIQKHRDIDIDDYRSILPTSSCENYSGINEKDNAVWFFSLWSKMEAIMKADGRGMLIDPGCILVSENQGVVADSDIKWHGLPCPEVQGYSMALYSNNANWKLRWFTLDNGELKETHL